MTYQELATLINEMSDEQKTCNAMAFFPLDETDGYFITVQGLDPLDALPGKRRLANATVSPDQRFMVSVKRLH